MSDLETRKNELLSTISTMLSAQLGTYDLGNGQTKPAIAVLPDPDYGMNYPPPGVSVTGTGLEVVLVLPRLAAEMALGGVTSRSDWMIYVNAHRKGTVPLDAAMALFPVIPEILQVFSIPANEATGSPESVRLTVSDYTHIALKEA